MTHLLDAIVNNKTRPSARPLKMARERAVICDAHPCTRQTAAYAWMKN